MKEIHAFCSYQNCIVKYESKLASKWKNDLKLAHFKEQLEKEKQAKLDLKETKSVSSNTIHSIFSKKNKIQYGTSVFL